jgi:hypothetical protein
LSNTAVAARRQVKRQPGFIGECLLGGLETGVRDLCPPRKPDYKFYSKKCVR